jgi:hypothetical protein
MGARRSDRRRTAISLPRGNCRPPSASTVLLSFALLAAISTPMGSRGLAVRVAGALSVSKSPSGVASSAAAGAAAAPGVAGGKTLATVPQRPTLLLPPRPTGVLPKRAVAALDRDADSAATQFAVIAAPPDVGAVAVASDRIDAGATATFLAFASDSSRTRGQPVSDC